MSMPSLKSNFDYLIGNSGCNGKAAKKVLCIIREISASDPFKRTKFEFSLQVKNNDLSDGLRFVNYDTHYCPDEARLYRNRLILLRSLSEYCVGEKPLLRDIFRCLVSIFEFRLPVYFGLDISRKGGFLLKLYLNFFNVYRNNPVFAKKTLKNVLALTGLKIRLKQNEVPLLGFTISRDSGLVYNKIYYLYEKNCAPDRAGIGKEGSVFFNWLNHYNRLDYFDVMERYGRDNKLISRKVEIHPRQCGVLLKRLCVKINASRQADKISAAIKVTGGALEAVAWENRITTFYIRLLNYGGKKGLQLQ